VIFEDEHFFVTSFQDILAPISSGNPTGVNVRRTSVFDWIGLNSARQGEHGGCLCPHGGRIDGPDWKKVERLATIALSSHTKDLQIAIWLVQALTFNAGLNGLCAGLFILREIIRRYWAGLHTACEEYHEYDWESDDRVVLLEWFKGQLATWITMAPFTPESNGRSFSFAEYAVALHEYRSRTSYHELWFEQSSEAQRALADAGEDFLSKSFHAISRVRQQLDRLLACLEEVDSPVSFDYALGTLQSLEANLRPHERFAQVKIEPAFVHPAEIPKENETPEECWQRSLELIRLDRPLLASPLIESTFSGTIAERERFFRRTELAAALIDARKFELATDILEFLSQQIDQFQLHIWEEPKTLVRVWTLLFDSYSMSKQHQDRAKVLAEKLGRNAPWTLIR